jgi:hypothetical protein
LGISRATLYRKLKRYRIPLQSGPDEAEDAPEETARAAE